MLPIDDAFTLPPISLTEGMAQPAWRRSTLEPASLDRRVIELEPRAAASVLPSKENYVEVARSPRPHASAFAALWLVLPCLVAQLRDSLCDVGCKAAKQWRDRGR